MALSFQHSNVLILEISILQDTFTQEGILYCGWESSMMSRAGTHGRLSVRHYSSIGQCTLAFIRRVLAWSLADHQNHRMIADHSFCKLTL